jgi:hypothetical protein
MADRHNTVSVQLEAARRLVRELERLEVGLEIGPSEVIGVEPGDQTELPLPGVSVPPAMEYIGGSFSTDVTDASAVAGMGPGLFQQGQPRVRYRYQLARGGCPVGESRVREWTDHLDGNGNVVRSTWVWVSDCLPNAEALERLNTLQDS